MKLTVHEDEGSNDKKAGGLHLDKETDSRNYHSEYYEGGKNYELSDLDNDIPKLLESDENIKQIQIIAEIYDPETKLTSYVSQILTPSEYYDMMSVYDSIEDFFDDDVMSDDAYSGSSFVAGGVSVRTFS